MRAVSAYIWKPHEKKIEAETNGGIKTFQENEEENENEMKEENKEKGISPVKSQLKNTDQIKTNLIKNPKIKNQTNKSYQIKSFQD